MNSESGLKQNSSVIMKILFDLSGLEGDYVDSFFAMKHQLYKEGVCYVT